MKRYIVEFIGTFFLVLTIGLTVLEPGAGNMAPLAIGAILAVMIFSGGHVSGAHYNPAVTTAVTIRGRCARSDVLGYWIAQLLAGAAAASLAVWFKGFPDSVPRAINLPHALIAEFIFTFALANTVINVATAKGTSGNSFYGLAIGFTVLAGAYALNGISGGSLNPAVTLALVIFGKLSVNHAIAYAVTQLAAGAAAGKLYTVLNPDDK